MLKTYGFVKITEYLLSHLPLNVNKKAKVFYKNIERMDTKWKEFF